MRISTALAYALLLAAPAPLAAQGPQLDGRWEVKMDMDMPGMPMKMPTQTVTRCVTKEEAADPTKVVPDAGRGGGAGACKVSDYKTVGNTVSWAVKCEGAQPMSGTGEMVYGDGAYKGTMKMSMAGGQMMTMLYTGKRLGDCTK